MNREWLEVEGALEAGIEVAFPLSNGEWKTGLVLGTAEELPDGTIRWSEFVWESGDFNQSWLGGDWYAVNSGEPSGPEIMPAGLLMVRPPVGLKVTCPGCGEKLVYGIIDPEPVDQLVMKFDCPKCGCPVPLRGAL